MIKQYTWVVGARIVSALLQLATLSILANWLSPGEFGLVASVASTAIVLQALSDLGISTYVVRNRASDPNDGTIASALQANNRISLMLCIFSGLAICVLALIIDPIFYLMVPLAIWIGAEKNTDVWLGVALADGDAYINLLSIVGRRAISLTVMIGLWLAGGEPVSAYSLGLASSAIIASFIGRQVLRKRLPDSVSLRMRDLLKLTWPYWMHSTATQLRNMDTLLVVMVASPAQAGYYAVASKLTGPLRILPVSLASVLLPSVARSKGFVSRQLALTIVVMISIMTIVYISIAQLVPWAIPHFLGEEYKPSVWPVQIVCYGLVFGATASLFASVLQGQGKPNYVGYTSVITSIYCVPAIWFGTSVWGAAGAAFGLVTSFGLQSFLLLITLATSNNRSIYTKTHQEENNKSSAAVD